MEESLDLDLTSALAGIDELERRATAAFESAGAAIADSINNAVESAAGDAANQLQSSLAAIDAQVEITAAIAGDPAADLADQIGTPTVSAELDGSWDAVFAAYDQILAASAAPVVVTVEADDTGLQAVAEDLSGIGDQLTGLESDLNSLSFSGSDSGGAGLIELGTIAGGATGGIAGLEAGAASLSPELAAVAGAAAGAGAGLGFAFNEAVSAESALIRLRAVVGDNTDAFLEFDGTIAGFNGTMGELALKTGSGDEGLIIAAANFADLGKQAGYTNEQVTDSGQRLALLASYVASTRPQLGSADQVIQRLGISLQRGGRFAQNMGLDIGNAGQIADRAAQLFDKPKTALTGYEKSVAGLTIAYEKLGDKVGPAIEKAADNPQIALRTLEVRLGEVAEAAGGPFLDPVIDTLEEIAPLAESVATITAKVAEGGIRVFGVEAQGLAQALGFVADIMENRVIGSVAAGGGAFLVARGSVQALLNVVGRVAPNLAATAVNLNLGDGIVNQFRNVASASQQIEAGLARASAAGVEFAATNAQLTGELLALQAATAAESGERLLANAAVEANTILQEKNAAVLAASATVAELAAEKQALLVSAELGSTEAKEALIVTDEALAAAEQALTTAQVEQAAAAGTAEAANTILVSAVGETAVGVEGAAAAASAASAEMTAATAATSEMAGATVALNPILLAVAAAAAIAVGAFVLFGTGSDDLSEQLDRAAQSADTYTSAITDAAAATGTTPAGQSALRQRFQEDEAAAKDLIAALEEANEDAIDVFRRAGISFEQGGKAIRGSADDARAFRQALIDAGEVTFDFENQAARAAAAAEYVRSGSTSRAEAAAEPFRPELQNEQPGVRQASGSVNPSDAAAAFEDQLRAQQRYIEGLRRQSAAELETFAKTGDASETSATRQLQALGELETGNIAAAAALLQTSDAAARQRDQIDLLAQVTGTAGASTARLARDVLTASNSIKSANTATAEQIASARALVGSAGFSNLPKQVQDAANAVAQYGDEAIQAAKANGELFASTGELALGMGDLTSQLSAAADKFVSILSAQQALGQSTRSLNNLLDDLVPTSDRLGTSLDEASASFDLSSINADNYTEYLSLLPKAVQDAIEGRDKAVDDANREIADAQAENPLDEGLIAARFAAGEFAGGKPGSADAAKDKAEKSAEQKAAETRAAIANNQKALDDLGRTARDNARELADYFDQVGVAIRKESAEMLKNGATLDEVAAKIAARRDEFVALMEQAGFTEQQINQTLDAQRLLPSQVVIDLQASGVDKIVGAIERLATIMAGLEDISPKVANAIRGIADPTKQVEEFNKAIAELPDEEQIKLRLIYNVPDPEAFKAENERKLAAGAPFRLAVQLGLDRDAALRLDQEFADVIAGLPGISVTVTEESVRAVEQFGASIQETVNAGYAVLMSPDTDPAEKARAEEELKELARQREALIKAGIAPEELSVAEAELAKLAADRTIDFKTTLNGKPWTDYAAQSEFVGPDGVDREHQADRPVSGRSKKVDAESIAEDVMDGLFGPESGTGTNKGRGGHRSRAVIEPTVDADAKKQAERDLADVRKDRTVKVSPELDGDAAERLSRRVSRMVTDAIDNLGESADEGDYLDRAADRRRRREAEASPNPNDDQLQIGRDRANAASAVRDATARAVESALAGIGDRVTRPKVEPQVDGPSNLRARATIAELSRDRTVKVSPDLDSDAAERLSRRVSRMVTDAIDNLGESADDGDYLDRAADRRRRDRAIASPNPNDDQLAISRDRANAAASIRDATARAVEAAVATVTGRKTRATIEPQVDEPARLRAKSAIVELGKDVKPRVRPDTDDGAKNRVEDDRRSLGRDIRPAVKPRRVSKEDIESIVAAATELAARTPVRLRSVVEAPTSTPTGTTSTSTPSSSGGAGPAVGARLTPAQQSQLQLPTLSPRVRTTREINGRQYRWDGTGWVRVFAEGGTTFADDDELIRRRLEMAAAGESAASDAGGFDTEFAIREKSTNGEYLISRDPAFRDRNLALAETAVADLGGSLLPAASAPGGPGAFVAIPDRAPQASSADPELLAAIRDLSATIATSGAGRPPVTIGQITTLAPDPDLKSSRRTIEDVRTAVVTTR